SVRISGSANSARPHPRRRRAGACPARPAANGTPARGSPSTPSGQDDYRNVLQQVYNPSSDARKRTPARGFRETLYLATNGFLSAKRMGLRRLKYAVGTNTFCGDILLVWRVDGCDCVLSAGELRS